MRRRLRRCRLRHKIHAIKTRPNNPLRFLQCKKQVSSLFGKRFNLCRSQNDVQNKKTFSQQTIPPSKSKDQPFESERTHFDTGFNKSNVAMHRQTFIFLLSHKTQPFNKKQPTGTINHVKHSRQTIPATTQSIIRSKQNITNTTNYLINQPQNQSQEQPQQPIAIHQDF